MFHVVLYQPEIPPNTGNVIRLCANTGCTLHLIEPLGFEPDDRRLKRAGLDYHDWARVLRYPNFRSFQNTVHAGRLFTLSTRNPTLYTSPAYRPGDVFVFGPETRGLTAAVRESVPSPQRITLPMVPGNRSMNLANAVSVVVFEAWRQQGFGSHPTELTADKHRE